MIFSKSRPLRSATFAVSLIAVLASVGGAAAKLPDDCLNGGATNGDRRGRTSCTADARRYALASEVGAVIRALELEGVPIKFMACRAYGFSAASSPAGSPFSAIITYPAQGGVGIGKSQIAPLAHELGHIVQLRQAGGLAKLRIVLPSIEREVGADFLAGYALRRMLIGQNVSDFASSLDLPGQYAPTDDDHGEPLLRTNAFRRGFYLIDREHPTSVPELHLRFQTVIINELLHG